MENIPLKGTVTNSFHSIDETNQNTNSNLDTNHDDNVFVCNVCLESVKNNDPVVTQCGHLYCWSCLYRWLNTNHTTCPVCKAGVTQENVIPIFIRGSTIEDPRLKLSQQSSEQIPNRPLGHRPEPVHNLDSQDNNLNPPINIGYNFAGISFNAGFGFFPSLFGLQFQSFAPAPSTNGTDSDEDAQQAYLSRVLLFLGLSVILCLLFF